MSSFGRAGSQQPIAEEKGVGICDGKRSTMNKSDKRGGVTKELQFRRTLRKNPEVLNHHLDSRANLHSYKQY